MEVKEYINEVWKPVRGYLGLYEVSNFGRVRSVDKKVKSTSRNGNVYEKSYKGRILSPNVDGGGYLTVMLSKDGIVKRFHVHRLVAEAFIPNPHNLPQVNHKDEDKTNNIWTNLEWVDAKTNANYGTRNERMRKKKGNAVYQYTIDGVFVKRWDSESDAASYMHVTVASISACCKGKLKTVKGFVWKYGK